MEIVTLIENLVYKGELRSEHGLSFLIKTEECKILFDVGQTGTIVHNAEILEEDLSDVDYIILSHGHYDHTGGLEKVLEVNKTAKIIMKRKALQKKYSNTTGTMREIGFKLMDKYKEYPNEFLIIEENLNINENIEVITTIDNHTDFEKNGKNLFVKEGESYVEDKFQDELFLIIKKYDKLNIITGCSHNGIINIIKTAMNKTKIDCINLVLGGMHLSSLNIKNEALQKISDRKIQKTVEELKKLNIDKIYTNHCTGIDGFMKLKNELRDKIFYSYTGFKINL
ncbi:MBL fold metallo-hydrolase [uncultured Ilyobacter sp.]|uniref:MBL fold metallo-hydrolase n=1 Tax=uncultured Ilyobacter sp. TaxID=544433 RepID=UPI0029C6FF83|nr:MBL fold metallo-hydrolase [uncultured Ilyobacter sp.]